MQKYTGTIPKTIRSVALRPVRTKSNSSVPNGFCSECSQFSVENECKRCRTAKYRMHSNEQQPNEAATSNPLPPSCSNGIGKTSASANGSSCYNGDLARLRIECLLDEAAVSSSADAVAIFSVHCTENDIVEALVRIKAIKSVIKNINSDSNFRINSGYNQTERSFISICSRKRVANQMHLPHQL